MYVGRESWFGIGRMGINPRKEVIQPQLPLRLPCYDFTPIISPTLTTCAPHRVRSRRFRCCQLWWCDGRCVQGPRTYSPRYADPRLLATPTFREASCSLSSVLPDGFQGSAHARALASRCTAHCSVCVAQDNIGHADLTSSPPSSALLAAVRLDLQLAAGVALVAGLNPTPHGTS